MAEIITDLANGILSCNNWDHKTICSPYSDKIPPAQRLPNSVPFIQALPSDVDVKPSLHGFVDGYISDLVPIILDQSNNAEIGA